MPPVFAQPSPISRGFSGSSGGSGGYAAMANAIMDRQAQDADRYTRMQLAMAGMGEQRAEHRDEMALRREQMANQFALQDNAAAAEMNQWMMRQRFTIQDQQELARQQNAVSELQDKRDKGEITDKEFYRMLGRVAPRVNYLAAKEQHTRTQAMAQAKKQQAELFQEQMKQVRIANSIQEGELSDQIDVHIPTENAQYMSEFMAEFYEDLKPGTPDYDAILKMEATKQGKGFEFMKTKQGNVPLATVKGIGGSKAAGESGTARSGDVNKTAESLADKAAKFFADHGKTPTRDELKAKALEYADVQGELVGELSGSAGKKRAEEKTKQAMEGFDRGQAAIMESPNLGPTAKRMAQETITDLKRLMTKYPADQRKGKVAEKIDLLTSRLEQIMAQAQMKVSQGQPATAAPQTQQDSPGPLGRSVRQRAADAVLWHQRQQVNAAVKAKEMYDNVESWHKEVARFLFE